MPRMFLVDDTDPLIKYAGSWLQTGGDLSSYNQTSHSINGTGKLSFQFIGDSVRALTSIEGYHNAALFLNATCFCFIDSARIDDPVSPRGFNDFLILCDSRTLHYGVHTLSIEFHGGKHWVDQIQYTQPTSVAYERGGRTLYVENSDPNIHYGLGWTMFGSSAKTETNGSTMQFTFNGTSLMWYGTIPTSNFATNASSALYSIDGQSPTTFPLLRLPSVANSQYSQLIFRTPQLSSGQHTLQVVHMGNNQTMPLTLDYLAIEGVESSPSPSGAQGKGLPIGAIVGTIGSVVALAIFTALFTLSLRRRRRDSGFNDRITTNNSPPATEIPTDNISSRLRVLHSDSSNVQTAVIPLLVPPGSSGLVEPFRSADAPAPDPLPSPPIPCTSIV